MNGKLEIFIWAVVVAVCAVIYSLLIQGCATAPGNAYKDQMQAAPKSFTRTLKNDNHRVITIPSLNRIGTSH